MKKFYTFLFLIIFSTILTLPLIYFYKSFSNGVLFFSAFSIAFLSSFVAFFIWRKFYKEFFESFLVFCTLFTSSIIFVYFIPVSLDRSLSSFIYFYSVENEKITKQIHNQEYFENYIQRRFEDGEKIGFLKCDKNNCYPTFKTKLAYYILYPLGRFSNTTKEYENFKNMVEKTKN